MLPISNLISCRYDERYVVLPLSEEVDGDAIMAMVTVYTLEIT